MKKHLFLLFFALVASVGTTFASITVSLDANSCSTWSKVYLWAWTSKGNVFASWPGEVLKRASDSYSYTFDESITSVNIIWTNGSDQTVDITNVTDNTFYALNQSSGTAITVRVVRTKIGNLYYSLDDTNLSAEVVQSIYEYDELNSGLTSVTIPSTIIHGGKTYSVTSIRSNAFWYCSGLTSVTIGSSVTSIGDAAFQSCIGLTSIEIPNSVTNIENSAFSYCRSLKSITIGNSVISIGDSAFYECSGLTSIEIPNSVTSIGKRTFDRCYELDSITWNAKDYSGYAPFEVIKTHITSFVFGEDVETIPACLCSGMYRLTSIIIPDSVTSIGHDAFYRCTGLTSVTIPNSVTNIGNYAFSVCTGLTSVTIGNSVTSIGSYAFSYCSGLTSIEIPNSVTSIGHQAFSDCSGLTSIEIPNSVTSIGSATFIRCSSLTNIEIPNSVTSIGHGAFKGCISLPIEDNIRYADTYLVEAVDKALSSYTIKEGTKWIGSEAFYECSGLTSIEIPNSVTSIGSYAFSYCSGLTSIEIPNSVTSIEYGAFSDCSGLTSVHITDLASWCAKAFENSSANPLYYAKHLFLNGVEVIDLAIPNGVTGIGDFTFYNCSVLTSVSIPNSVTSIGSCAFSYCSGLTSVTIPESVTSIGSYAFDGCSGLTSITIEAETPPSIDSYPFSETNDCPIYVPCNAVDAYKAAWWDPRTGKERIKGNCLSYSITFVNWDGSALQTLDVTEGELPEYSGTTPTRPDDEEYAYTFSGWTPEIEVATEDATYTATYEATKKSQGLENQQSEFKNQKLIKDGQLLILRGDKIYTLQGQEIK